MPILIVLLLSTLLLKKDDKPDVLSLVKNISEGELNEILRLYKNVKNFNTGNGNLTNLLGSFNLKNLSPEKIIEAIGILKNLSPLMDNKIVPTSPDTNNEQTTEFALKPIANIAGKNITYMLNQCIEKAD